ncbi:hypothetical protein DVH05_003618 [Phytophthora capsici]|nr:hypothetical protein DVH05_003618 [Phytophthora capsici]
MVRYLDQRMGNYVKTPYLEIAAADGNVEVIEALRPWAEDPEALAGPLHLALLHSQQQVYNLLIETLSRDDAQELNNVGLNLAVMAGQTEMVKLLLRKGAVSAENMATYYAAKSGDSDMMEILLAECKLPPSVLGNALRLAVLNDHCAVVESLLNHVAGHEAEAKGDQTVKHCIGNSFCVAARRGSINMVKTLLGRCPDDGLRQELREAGTTGKFEVAKLLLSECERRHLEDSVYIAAVVEKAAQYGDLEMAKLFVHKCLPPTVGAALVSAVANKNVGMLELFAQINEVYPDGDPYKRRALVRTAEDDQVEMVKILVQHCDQPTIESAVAMIPTTTSVAVFNLLLEKLNSHARKRIFCTLAAKGSVNLAGQLLDQIDSVALRWALMSAASNGHPDMIQVLLSKADTLSVDCALEAAAVVGELDVVVLLRGRCSSQGWSDAVSSASANGHEEIVQALKSKCRRISGEE